MIANQRIAAMVVAVLVPALAAAASESPPSALDSGLATCAAIASPQPRLSCYDALAGRPTAVPSAKSVAAGTGAAVPVAGSTTTNAPATGDASFGLKESPPKQDPVSITARIVSMSENTQGRVVVTLDNHQRWEFQGPDSALSNGDVVVITTASLGSFLMTTPVKHKLRVKRLS